LAFILWCEDTGRDWRNELKRRTAADGTVKFNPNHWPAGTPGGIGGQFAPTGLGADFHGDRQAEARGRRPDVPRHALDESAVTAHWDDFHSALEARSGTTDVQREVIGRIFASEGGLQYDASDRSTFAGLTQRARRDAAAHGDYPQLRDVVATGRASAAQVALMYHRHLDYEFRGVGGIGVLDGFADRRTAGAVGDVVFREGRSGGARMVRQAFWQVVDGLPHEAQARIRARTPNLTGDAQEGMSRDLIDALHSLDRDGYGCLFREVLRRRRTAFRSRESLRNSRFGC
jgi:hypothetical protein